MGAEGGEEVVEEGAVGWHFGGGGGDGRVRLWGGGRWSVLWEECSVVLPSL